MDGIQQASSDARITKKKVKNTAFEVLLNLYTDLQAVHLGGHPR